MKKDILRLIDHIPNDGGNKFKRQYRVHQGWWRTVVLLEKAGPHPIHKGKKVCNTFELSENNQHTNFLSSAAVEAVENEIFKRQKGGGAGIFDEKRLRGNLLSSQPLSFNFWALLNDDDSLAQKFLNRIIPGFGEIIDIGFERKPKWGENPTDDKSAFDVMIEYVDSNEQRTIFGIECKYTDELTSEKHDKPAYQRIYEKAKGVLFTENYDFYIQPSFNQLFRNQLMAHAHEMETGIRGYCGLFCTERDQKAIKIGTQFKNSLTGKEERFLIITYEQFIETMQKLDLSWEQRVQTMLLWARYLGLELSEATYQACTSND